MMNYYRVDTVSVHLNPKNLWYDALFSDKEFSIDQQLFRKIIDPHQFKEIELPVLGEIQLIKGGELRDRLEIPGLKSQGVVFSVNLFNELHNLNIPLYKSRLIDIKARNNTYPYQWIILSSLEVFLEIDLKGSVFYQGDDYWGKRNVEFSTTEDFLNQLAQKGTTKDQISFESLKVLKSFDYDLFKLPRLSVHHFCSDRFKSMIERQSFSGFMFTKVNIFS